MQPINGVNIGGWLVLEPWITPSLFAGADARDEFGIMPQIGDRLTTHRQTFITEDDIAFLAGQGVQSLRLPVPHWLFGGYPPYVACSDRVDWLLAVAYKYGLSVLLDLHTVPGSQNGEAHSGRKGNVGWPTDTSLTQTLNVLSKLAKSYGDHPALLGIELVNEPSARIPHRQLLDFYRLGIETVRVAAPQCRVVVHDAFRPHDWMSPQLAGYDNILLDVHLYRAFGSDATSPVSAHLQAVGEWHDLIASLQQHLPVVVGEWSLGLSPEALKGVHDTAAAERAFLDAQLEAFSNAYAHYFWTYKTETMRGWNYRSVLQSGNH